MRYADIPLELISEVEGIKLKDLRRSTETQLIRYRSKDIFGDGKKTWSNLNLFPEIFSFNCKKWASKYIVDKERQSKGCIISSWTTSEGKGRARILDIDETFKADTEVEAIIKATEWIRLNGKKL